MTVSPIHEKIQEMQPEEAELLVLTQVKKHLGHSHVLKKLGYKISVTVFRLSEEDGKTLTSGNTSPAETKRLALELAQPFYQLRASHEQEARMRAVVGSSAPIEEQRIKYESIMRESYVYPKGGYTKVELVHPATAIAYKGECHFPINTHFNRQKANRNAFGKMFGKMLHECSLGHKRGKTVINGLVS